MDLSLIIPVVGALINIGEQVYTFIQNERTRLQQSGEWTADQEAQFQTLMAQRAASPWQQPQG